MQIEDIKKEITEYVSKTPNWNILLNGDIKADYYMGYYYDAKIKKWITYQNAERGFRMEKTFDDELSALMKLKRYVKYEYKVVNHLM